MYPAKFAAVYDRLMDDFDYPGWAEYYLALARQAGVTTIRTLCECGCGTGSMSVAFARKGISVTGVDLSPAMLQLAAEKARKNGLMIPFVCQDMCHLALHRPVDALFCPCDGLNYLLTDRQTLAFFARAFSTIRPGGVFAFDLSTPFKLYHLPDAPCYEDREDLTYIWVSERRGELVDMSLTFFQRQGGGQYLRFDEHQTQRAHTLQELTTLLQRAGFVHTTCWGDRTFDEPGAQELRWHICAVRP